MQRAFPNSAAISLQDKRGRGIETPRPRQRLRSLSRAEVAPSQNTTRSLTKMVVLGRILTLVVGIRKLEPPKEEPIEKGHSVRDITEAVVVNIQDIGTVAGIVTEEQLLENRNGVADITLPILVRIPADEIKGRQAERKRFLLAVLILTSFTVLKEVRRLGVTVDHLVTVGQISLSFLATSLQPI